MDVEEKELGRQYQGWIKEALKQGNLRRNAVWSSKLAVGDDGFVERVKANLGRLVYPACRVKPSSVSLGEMHKVPCEVYPLNRACPVKCHKVALLEAGFNWANFTGGQK